ncbi:hypothetical protein [Chenggangzhangella methanolivorans]|uniref:Uncharacterized protein n=1 Tax=Chenggangzhangella methanolivorans TaxID=1437009 RepID=A0A9E6R8V7_9HYPH|nr:hypothetical protein [Chenggangzhangella methanolivorans]QZN98958.1 hypothetical protein K6K41_18930 [Chenggangzhangella methanolivorans]
MVTVVNLKKALDPSVNGTLGAVEGFIDSKGFGATGFALLPDGKHGALAHAEMKHHEDGGRHINVVDLKRMEVTSRIKQRFGEPGFECPPPVIPKRAPDPNFGCFPDSNGVTVSPLGGGTIFTANGGTDDVSVISVEKALKGLAKPEVARIPMQAGGFGISTSPDGTLVAHASRENAQTGKEGNTVSLIDVKKALKNPAKAEVARIRVGTDDKKVGTPAVRRGLHAGRTAARHHAVPHRQRRHRRREEGAEGQERHAEADHAQDAGRRTVEPARDRDHGRRTLCGDHRRAARSVELQRRLDHRPRDLQGPRPGHADRQRELHDRRLPGRLTRPNGESDARPRGRASPASSPRREALMAAACGAGALDPPILHS